jgi:chaperone BCS1
MVSPLPKADYCSREFCLSLYFSDSFLMSFVLVCHVCRTTNHLERLDPALTRPGRMDVWVEFKNASKWQAELLFTNFFSEVEEEMRGAPTPDEIAAMEKEFAFLEAQQKASEQQAKEAEANGVKIQRATLEDEKISFVPQDGSIPSSMAGVEAMVAAVEAKEAQEKPEDESSSQPSLLIPPPILEKPRAPLGPAKIAALAKQFGNAIPDCEHSVASLQGCE